MNDPWLCVVGDRGRGKTTVVNALLRRAFVPAFHGRDAPVVFSVERALSVDGAVRAVVCGRCEITMHDDEAPGSDAVATVDGACYLARLGTTSSPVDVPESTRHISVRGDGEGQGAIGLLEGALDTALPPTRTVLFVLSEEDLSRGSALRRDVSSCDSALPKNGVFVVNTRTAGENATRLEVLCANVLSVERNRVFAFNARLGLAACVAGTEEPDRLLQLRDEVFRRCSTLRGTASAAASTTRLVQHRIETDGRFATVDAGSGPDRYTPQAVLCPLPAEASQRLQRRPLPQPACAEVDRARYVPQVLRSQEIAADLVASMAAFKPKSVRAA